MGDQGANRDKELTPTGIRNYAKLLEYLSDPDKDWPKRSDYSQLILNYKKANQIYNTLSSPIITEIEIEAGKNRIERSSRQGAIVRRSLYKRANGYSHEAVKIITNKVKNTDKEGNVTEETKAMYVPYTKHYPPDAQAAKEWFDRTEGKVIENHKHEHSGAIKHNHGMDTDALKKAMGKKDGGD